MCGALEEGEVVIGSRGLGGCPVLSRCLWHPAQNASSFESASCPHLPLRSPSAGPADVSESLLLCCVPCVPDFSSHIPGPIIVHSRVTDLCSLISGAFPPSSPSAPKTHTLSTRAHGPQNIPVVWRSAPMYPAHCFNSHALCGPGRRRPWIPKRRVARRGSPPSPARPEPQGKGILCSAAVCLVSCLFVFSSPPRSLRRHLHLSGSGFLALREGNASSGPGLAWRAGAGGGWPRVRARWAGGSGGVSVTHAPESRGREASRLSPRWAAQDSWLVRLHGKPISH